MPYTRPYTGGFQDFPNTTTPIDASALNTIDVGVKTANDQFQTVTTAQRATLTPSVGQAVWDSDLRQLMVFMNASGGNAWQPVGNRIVCASTTRPGSPFEGQEIYETDTNQTLVYDGSSWIEVGDLDNTNGVPSGLAPLFAAWTSYTPTISQVGNVTKTVTYARYLKIGRLAIVQARLDIIAGTAGTAGTSATVSLPSAVVPVGAASGGPNFGFGWIYDNSTNTPYTTSVRADTTTTMAFMSDATSSSYWGSIPSIGLAVNDQVHLTYICETTS